jgi:hypothetical protein
MITEVHRQAPLSTRSRRGALFRHSLDNKSYTDIAMATTRSRVLLARSLSLDTRCIPQSIAMSQDEGLRAIVVGAGRLFTLALVQNHQSSSSALLYDMRGSMLVFALFCSALPMRRENLDCGSRLTSNTTSSQSLLPQRQSASLIYSRRSSSVLCGTRSCRRFR